MKKCAIIAIGSGAGKALQRFQKSNLYDRVLVDTDKMLLSTLNADIKLLIGENLCEGLSCAGNYTSGQKALNESKDEILRLLQNYDKLFIIDCLGGGAGSGIILELAKYLKKDYLITITTPFRFEGIRRATNAQTALDKLNELDIKPIIINNETLLTSIDKSATFTEVFSIINDRICQEVYKIIKENL